MRICEFCKTFQISHQAVYAKIKKYAAELEGHISKNKGNVTDLDPFAVNLLKPKKASYKALDERNYYLFKKNKEIVSENERFKAERDELVSKKSDYEAVIEYLKKENKEYADSVALLTQECERYKKECSDAKALYKIMEIEFEKEKAKLKTENEELSSISEARAESCQNQMYRLRECDEKIADLTSTLSQKNDEIVRLRNEIAEFKSHFQAADKPNVSKQNNVFKNIFGLDKK